MGIEELYEIADREIRLGLFDRDLMRIAMGEAKGVKPHAEQIYWRLRSAALQEEAKRNAPVDSALYLREVRLRLSSVEKSRRLRASLLGWLWVVVCFVSLVASCIFFWAAKAALIRGSGAFYGYAISGVFAIVIGVAAYVVCKRDAGDDPFAYD